MRIDNNYCMSSFLSFRYIARPDLCFGGGTNGCIRHVYERGAETEKIPCRTSGDIENVIRRELRDADPKSTALLLSGGIDSGILASYMPEGTCAYTVSSPASVAALEVERAARVCERYHLEHRVVEVTWADYDSCIDDLMRHDGCPVYANEPQVYALAKKIRDDGFDTVVYGEAADTVFGGIDQLLSKDWSFDEWIERFTFVQPERVLQTPVDVTDVYEPYRIGENGIDFIRFSNEVFLVSSTAAYRNPLHYLGFVQLLPYTHMKMAEPLDLRRVRSGDSKYLLRELYRERFPGFDVPEKIAMARAVDLWLKDWEGPRRPEFKPGCIDGMTGEQKFLVYSLERFLNLMGL